MKAGGGAKQNASLKQGAQVSTATQRAATTTRHRHTEKLNGGTYQPLYLPRPARGREEGGANCHTKARFVARKYCTTFESRHASSEAW